jgi:hypothetical protein
MRHSTGKEAPRSSVVRVGGRVADRVAVLLGRGDEAPFDQR